MAMLKYEDEKTLQRRICNILNRNGYHFKKEKDLYFCDIVDTNIKAYCEVKTNGKFAPQQLIYGIVKEGIKDAQYLIDTYKDLPIGENYTIGEVFQRLKDNEDPDDIDKKLRIMIKSEIEKRLNEIGYWNYLPIPIIN